MTRILITDMSGTGKSSAIERLIALGQEAIDADASEWSEWARVPNPSEPPGSPPALDWVWRESRMAALLDQPRDGALFVGGCAPNQGRFRDCFDRVVLLSAPEDVILDRIATRTTNSFGKSPAERSKILDDLRAVEPLLRAFADLEIDTGATPLDEVVAMLLALGA
jgi:shikimate kinase